MPVITDESRMPLIVETHDGALSLDEIDVMSKRMERWFSPRRLLGFVFDMRKAEVPSMNVIMRVVSLSREFRERERLYSAGRAFVVDNPLWRASLMGIFLLEQPPAPIRMVTTLEAGEDWVLERLRDRGAVG